MILAVKKVDQWALVKVVSSVQSMADKLGR